MDDAQLLRSYAESGSEAAFAALVQRHLNFVHAAAMCRVGGDYHHAKDVTQMVFALLARKAASLTHHPALTGWLYTSAQFLAARLLRRERRRQTREESTHFMSELMADSEPGMDWHRLGSVLDCVMRELNERDREIILWRFFDAQPFAVIGEKLGLSEKAAGMRVNRALERMRHSLIRRGADSSTAALALLLANQAMAATPAGWGAAVTASALAAVAGSNAPGWWRLLGKTRLGFNVSAILWVSPILCLPAIGAAAYELCQIRPLSTALAISNQEFEAQQERLRALTRTTLAADQKRTQPEKNVAKLPSEAPGDSRAAFQRFLAAYPAARGMAVAENKYFASILFGSFFRSAGLTPSQIEQFKDIAAGNWMQLEALSSSHVHVDEFPIPSEDQLSGIIDGQTYRQLQDYNHTIYAHFCAAQVAASVDGEAALSADQTDQLAQILADNTAAPQTGGTPYSSALAAVDWDSVLAQAKAVMSPAQWAEVEPIFINLKTLAPLPPPHNFRMLRSW